MVVTEPVAVGVQARTPALVSVLLVALAYYASGRLGLLLAIPPGYATAVWPASGIALAAALLLGVRVLPGVWLGSFAINIANGFDASSAQTLLNSLVLPAVIALGAALHAGIGAWLVRRYVGYRNILEQELDVVPMLLLGGPLACVVSASIGVGSLFLRGLIPAESVLFNWWTWWVGDSIGVLIFTPLVLAWSLRPRQQWLRPQLGLTLPLVALFAAVTGLFVYMSGREQARTQTEFDGWCNDLVRVVGRDLGDDLNAVYSIQGFFAGSDQVSRDEFQIFGGGLLKRIPGVRGLAWDVLVTQEQRAAFETQRRAGGLPDFSIRELDGGRLVPAGARPLYVVADYLVPAAGNAQAFGFDVNSEPMRAAALARARDSGEAVATPPLRLVQSPTDEPGVLFFVPVYRNGLPHETATERALNLAGYAVAGMHTAAFMQQALEEVRAGAVLEVTLLDVTAGADLLYSNARQPQQAGGLARSIELPVADRRWQLQIALPAQYLVAHRSWQAWILLAAGMSFTGLLGMFLLVVIGRGSRVAHLVEERTAQLQDANSRLAREAARSERFETESRARAGQLVSTNRELEQFAFVVSHDLQAPLRNIQSFVGLLEKRHGEALAGEAKEYLQYLRSSAADMGRLIEDLLQLSRVNPKRADMEKLRAADVLGMALANLRADIEARGALVEQAEMPEIFGDASLLTQLFQNLIANGIKFQRPGAVPRVQIGVELIKGEWRFSVADNGIGISEKNIGRLFQIFKRLHTAEEYPGTGIGLVLCQKIVGLHGGRIWVESKPGEGTTFYFTLPLQMPVA